MQCCDNAYEIRNNNDIQIEKRTKLTNRQANLNKNPTGKVSTEANENILTRKANYNNLLNNRDTSRNDINIFANEFDIENRIKHLEELLPTAPKLELEVTVILNRLLTHLYYLKDYY